METKNKNKNKVSNVIDFNAKKLEAIKDKLTENGDCITKVNLPYHIQNVTNLYLQIFSEMALSTGEFNQTNAILVRKELEKQFCFLFKIIDDEILGQEEL